LRHAPRDHRTTRSFKHRPPTPVIAERLQPWRRLNATRLLDRLANPPAPCPVASAETSVIDDGDPLRRISPAVYVQMLTGLAPGRDGKVSCPFHGAGRTPSLHVYSDPADGWYCYGCQRGGSIYDLGAELFGLSTRGRDLVELRRRLHEALGEWAHRPRRRSHSARSAHRAFQEMETNPSQLLGLQPTTRTFCR
jgi:hypothetical protein